MLKAYFKYLKDRTNSHGIHSPFVFKFYNEVLRKTAEIDDKEILSLRNKLLNDHSSIEVTDLGAGSRKQVGTSRKIAQIAKTAGINPKYGRLLSRIIDVYELESGLELGTSLGIGTSYLTLPKSMKQFVSIEGCPNVFSKAKENLNTLGRTNVEQLNASFDDALDDVLEKMESVDLAFIDGNHGYEPTLKYAKSILEKAHNETFIIFDDINWSPGMRSAWEEIIKLEEIHVSIELFRMGIVVKREQQAKEHFILKY